MKITYPDQDILLWDDDVSGAFRHIKYHPDVASTFAIIIKAMLLLPVALVFGSLTRAQEYEILATARKVLAEHLSRSWNLINKHNQYLSKVQYSEQLSPETTFAQAFKDPINPGVPQNGDNLKKNKILL